MTTIEAWRGFSALQPEPMRARRWGRAARSILRALGQGGAAVGRSIGGFAAARVQCFLAGHDDSFVREPGRLLLRCDACGRSTSGWIIAIGPPRVASRLPGRAPPHRMGRDRAANVTALRTRRPRPETPPGRS